MNKRISDMFDSFENEKSEPDCNENFDAGKIREMTMRKINSSAHGVNHKRKAMRTILIAAVIICLLTVTAVALGGMIYVEPEEKEVFVLELNGENEGKTMVFDEIALILRCETDKECSDVFFKAGWLPEEPNERRAVNPLYLFEAGLGHGDNMELYDEKLYSEELKKYRSNLEKAGLSEKEAENWYYFVGLTLERDIPYQIAIYTGDYLYKRDLTLGTYGGEVKIVKEAVLNNFQLLEVAVDLTDSQIYKNRDWITKETMPNYIFLFDQEKDCLVKIGGTLDMETLEKIAENIELYDTGIKRTAEEPEDGEWRWGLLEIGRG